MGDPTQYQGRKVLSYNAGLDLYTYKWLTDKAWRGTCRQLIVQLADGTSLRANYKFK